MGLKLTPALGSCVTFNALNLVFFLCVMSLVTAGVCVSTNSIHEKPAPYLGCYRDNGDVRVRACTQDAGGGLCSGEQSWA